MIFKKGGALALLQLLSVGGTLAHPGGLPRLQNRGGFVNVDDLMPLKDRLVKRVTTPDGTCGGTNGYTCGTDVNKCCSQYGYCGDTDLHCQTSENCQPAFGICTTGGSQQGRCGTQGANAVCASGECCSEGGYCGTTSDFCMAPLCQQGFGKCDADATPGGETTSGVARPLLGNVPYDEIYDCTVPGDVALTYDDGPGIYTDGIVDLLNSYNAKATFFVTGINNGKGAIDITPAWNAVIKKMYAAGHQIASHTWSHADLSTLTEDARRLEMYKNEMALRNILGFFPTYMRPPYSSCTALCLKTMQALGYHVTYFDLDTDDYDNDSPLLIQNAKNNFDNQINPSNPASDEFLVISHDIHEQTAHNLTAYMLDKLALKGYKAVTLGECLGDDKANWYRTAGAGTSSSSSSSTSSTSSTSSSSSSSSTSSTSSTTSSSSTSSTISSSSTSNTKSSSSSVSSTSSSKTSSTTSSTSSKPTSSSTSSTSSKPSSSTSSTSSKPTSSSSTRTSSTSSIKTSSSSTSATKTSSTSSTKTSSTKTSSTASPTPTDCAYKVGSWCATPLPTYTNIAGCWNTVGNCWDQGDVCWRKTDNNKCLGYQDVCQAQEDHCNECVKSNTNTCRFKPPVYPAN